MSEWRSLKNDPPPNDMKTFFVGHKKGGRIDYVFRWPHKRKMAFWCSGKFGNYPLTGYTPNVWYPGPPSIAGSDVEALQKGAPQKGESVSVQRLTLDEAVLMIVEAAPDLDVDQAVGCLRIILNEKVRKRGGDATMKPVEIRWKREAK